ncbi:MAG: hypothetical protein RLZZ74_2859 [Cyanobacteriota bacterium]|jgi:hypothetical protein
MSANSKLGEQLPALHGQKFTGVLTITTQNDQQQWEMFFHQGEYLWTEGGYHPNRSWRRNFRRYCPGVNQESIVLRNQSEMRSQPYCLLHILLQRKIIQREQVKALIENHAREVCFDLLQKEYNSTLKYKIENTSAHYLLKEGFSLSLISIDLEQILFKSQIEWSTWGSKGLASCSPHHAPLLHRYQDLQQQLPDLIFANMSRLLNGKRTLRDLAVVMDKSLLDLTCGIIPYFFKGYLRLLEIADLADAQAEK